MFRVVIIMVSMFVGISYFCLSQELHNVMCDKYYEYEYNIIEGLSFEISLDDDRVTNIDLELRYIETEEEVEIAFDRISFSEELPITYSSQILEQAIVMAIIKGPWEEVLSNPFKYWRIRVPACWSQIEDLMNELRGCVEVNECIIYGFEVIKNPKCDGITAFTKFRQTEYSICDVIETGETCGSISIDLKGALGKINMDGGE